jgi:hypothetical protein
MSITGADYEKVMALNAKGLTNAEIAAATGVSSRTVSRMRNGQWEPPSPASMPLLGRSTVRHEAPARAWRAGHALRGMTAVLSVAAALAWRSS